MSVPIIQTAFVVGEVSPKLFGHADLARMKAAASTFRNGYVGYQGGYYSRAGTLFVGFSKQTGRTVPPRLLPFQFSIQQGLVLEFGNLYMRVIKNGAFVVDEVLTIKGISNSNPMTVAFISGTLNVGDWVQPANVGGMTIINGNTFVVATATGSSVTLNDVYGNPVDSSAYPAWTAGGTLSRLFTLTTPYAEADLPYLKYTQSADVMSLCCVNQVTGTEYVPQELVRLSDSSWTILPPAFGAAVSPPGACSAVTSVAGSTAYGYVVTAVTSDGEESIASPIGTVTSAVDMSRTFGTNTVTWSAVAGAVKYNIYKAQPDDSNTGHFAGQAFGYAGYSFATTWLDGNIVPDFAQVPPLATNPFAPGQVQSIAISAGGASYAVTDSVTITSATGVGFVGVPIIGGAVSGQTLTLLSANGYVLNDVLHEFIGGVEATGRVIGVSGGTVNVALIGSQPFVAGTPKEGGGYNGGIVANQNNSPNTIITVAPFAISGSNAVVGVYIQNAGQNYLATDTVVFTSGTGSGAVGTVVPGPATGVNPSVVHYFQERRGYANTQNQPDTYFFSQPGLFTNYDFRIPTIDSDAITGTPWAVEVNGIQFALPMPGGDMILTGSSAWLLGGAAGGALNATALTPSAQNAQPQTYNGCSPTVPPFKVDEDVIYVQSKGSIYRRFNFQLYANIYTGEDVTINSSHLFNNFTIREHAWCEEPYKVLWSVRSDGIMLSCTINKPQQVLGWGRHDTNGLFQSVCSVTELPVDALYLAVQRFPGTNTAYMIERMDNRLWTGVESTWCVDAGLSLAQPQPAATLTASSAFGLGACTGVTGLVGGKGYSAGTTATVVDAPATPNGSNGPGTGAVPTLTIVAGVITAVVFSGGNQGTGYLNPQLVISDPANSGSGASATVTLSNSMTFTSAPGVFAAGNVGNVIRAGGGIAVVTAFTSATAVTANMLSPIVQTIPNTANVPVPFTSGNWTMTAPVNSIGGLFHLAGATVTGLADGNVIPPTVVSVSGSINLPAPTSPNVTGATAVTVGLGFQARLQSVYLDTGNPTAQGQRKKIADVILRLENSRGLKAGSNQPDGSTQNPMVIAPVWSGLADVPHTAANFPLAPYLALATPLRTGDTARIPVGGGFGTPGQVAVQQDNPLPMSILALISDDFAGDTPQLQAPKKEQQRRAG